MSLHEIIVQNAYSWFHCSSSPQHINHMWLETLKLNIRRVGGGKFPFASSENALFNSFKYKWNAHTKPLGCS